MVQARDLVAGGVLEPGVDDLCRAVGHAFAGVAGGIVAASAPARTGRTARPIRSNAANSRGDVRIRNGVLTTEDDDQALARMGVKGADCAEAAVEMANLLRRIDEAG